MTCEQFLVTNVMTCTVAERSAYVRHRVACGPCGDEMKKRFAAKVASMTAEEVALTHLRAMSVTADLLSQDVADPEGFINTDRRS